MKHYFGEGGGALNIWKNAIFVLGLSEKSPRLSYRVALPSCEGAKGCLGKGLVFFVFPFLCLILGGSAILIHLVSLVPRLRHIVVICDRNM